MSSRRPLLTSPDVRLLLRMLSSPNEAEAMMPWAPPPPTTVPDDFGWVVVVIGAVALIVIWVVLHRGP